VLPRLLSSERIRAHLFRLVSQLGIRYRASPAVAEGEPRLRAGPKAGDRLPDMQVTCDGRRTWLQQELSGPHLHLLLCGTREAWDGGRLADLTARHAGLLALEHLSANEASGVLVGGAAALAQLGVGDIHSAAQHLVRPDGHIAFRCGGRDLGAVGRFLDCWFGDG
jgi:hypothetical protein